MDPLIFIKISIFVQPVQRENTAINFKVVETFSKMSCKLEISRSSVAHNETLVEGGRLPSPVEALLHLTTKYPNNQGTVLFCFFGHGNQKVYSLSK